MWIGRNKDNIYKVMHDHYMKPVATRSLIHSDSAHPDNVKMNILVNEARRILRNCSPELDWTDTAAHLNYFVQRMQYSGYDKEARYKVMKKAINKHKAEKENRGTGERMFIPSKEVRKERLKKKKDKRTNWSEKDGQYEAVMFVEMTKGSELKKKVQVAAKRNKIKIKVQERSGTTLKKILQRSDPFSTDGCSRTNCVICTRGLNIDCRERGCVYQMSCKETRRKSM
jgi:hypothetical protein